MNICVCLRNEAVLVKIMVNGIVEALGMPLLKVAKHPVAVEERLQSILSNLEDCSTVALWGMGGVGKTTLARALFNRFRTQYDLCCFLEVGKGADKYRLPRLQEQVLKDLCGLEESISTVEQGVSLLEQRLSATKVLLVIDDVWDTDQQDALLVEMGLGSCVVITTRNKDLLGCAAVEAQLEVKQLSAEASLELLSWHAFGAPRPPAHITKVAASVATACYGLPLTLEVIGAHLRKAPEQKWRVVSERLHSGEIAGPGQEKVFARLQLSYDALSCRLKDMFLDVACMMLGMDVDTALRVWGEGSADRLEDLCSCSLLRLKGSGRSGRRKLDMHEMLQHIGRDMIQDLCRLREFGRHVWNPDRGREVLESAEVWFLLLAVAPSHLFGCRCTLRKTFLMRSWGLQGGKNATVEGIRATGRLEIMATCLSNLPNLRLLTLGDGIAFKDTDGGRTYNASIRYLSGCISLLPSWLCLPKLTVVKITEWQTRTLCFEVSIHVIPPGSFFTHVCMSVHLNRLLLLEIH